MPRFFFNLHECGTTVEDEEGRICESIDEAREKALCDAREIMCAELKDGKLCLACRVEVLDERHVVLLEVPFADAVEISGLPEERC